jgi:hypothetical protein
MKESPSIIEILVAAGFGGVVHYMVQQVRQFAEAGEKFARQHRGSEIMRRSSKNWMSEFVKSMPVEELLKYLSLDEVVKYLPPEKRLKGLSPEERLEGLSPEKRLQGLSPDEIIEYLKTKTLKKLAPKKAARLRKQLESLESRESS